MPLGIGLLCASFVYSIVASTQGHVVGYGDCAPGQLLVNVINRSGISVANEAPLEDEPTRDASPPGLVVSKPPLWFGEKGR